MSLILELENLLDVDKFIQHYHSRIPLINKKMETCLIIKNIYDNIIKPLKQECDQDIILFANLIKNSGVILQYNYKLKLELNK